MPYGLLVPNVTVLKAPHHGSRNGFTPGFLDAARSEVIVVSVGRNAYGHPSDAAISAFESVAATVIRTDQAGAVTVAGRRSGAYEVERR